MEALRVARKIPLLKCKVLSAEHRRLVFYHSLCGLISKRCQVITPDTASTGREQSLSVQELYSLRQQQALPILKSLKTWMMDAYSKVVPQSTIGKALNYSLQRWDKLCLYAQDGRLQIDNNLVENAIRPVAIGRKNYMFAGSHNGARRAAMLYSFLGNCKINKVNPFEWLQDILRRMPSHPVNRLEELLPNNWVQSKS